MTSKRAIAANRRNSRSSCGPQTAAGRVNASRNALRHGLTAVTHRPAAPQAEIERFARALCGEDDDRSVFAAALAIAETEMVLRVVREQKLAVVERLRDTTAIALAKGDNSFELAKARYLQMWLSEREVEALVPKLMEKYKHQMPPPLDGAFADLLSGVGEVPIRLKALLEECESDHEKEQALVLARKLIEERDEFEAVEAAMPDLKKLDRYEREAWSRQKRAMRNFMSTKLMLGYGAKPEPQPPKID